MQGQAQVPVREGSNLCYTSVQMRNRRRGRGDNCKRKTIYIYWYLRRKHLDMLDPSSRYLVFPENQGCVSLSRLSSMYICTSVDCSLTQCSGRSSRMHEQVILSSVSSSPALAWHVLCVSFIPFKCVMYNTAMRILRRSVLRMVPTGSHFTKLDNTCIHTAYRGGFRIRKIRVLQ